MAGDLSSKKLIIIGGGSAGAGFISSIRKRIRGLAITLIEPRDFHYYQPAWTLVGRGVFDIKKTCRPMRDIIPQNTLWVKDSVLRIKPEGKYIETSGGEIIAYDYLVIACGLTLCWDKIEGLEEALGQNGVTSNYSFEHARYTWELVKNLRKGKAIFTQPAMPIKCAGAPQKALYLSGDYWLRHGRLDEIDTEFCLAGQAIFGVNAFVPVLKSYLQKYRAHICYAHNLIRVDGEKKLATFEVSNGENQKIEVTKHFDMLHVVPPQSPPTFIAESGLGDAGGWCDVNKFTLQHQQWPDIFSLGDCCSAPNSKTAAAARKQIVIVAENLMNVMDGKLPQARYDGYGSCPLTVERGKVVLAEFGYENKLLPTFPFNLTRPNRLAWWLKVWFLPRFYWSGMLRGIEWLAKSK